MAWNETTILLIISPPDVTESGQLQDISSSRFKRQHGKAVVQILGKGGANLFSKNESKRFQTEFKELMHGTQKRLSGNLKTNRTKMHYPKPRVNKKLYVSLKARI